ncbi:hypothetical protein [Sphingomonas sp. 1P08PE]|uniref:hypothetical protein n=1 Tax=Sphingomonas sp. 1P08PE TaxID=554122 RepID=UPI0039A1CCCD
MASGIWVGPGDAANMVFDVRSDGVTAAGFALLRPRRNDRANSVATLAYAKLNPVEPTSSSPRTRCGWPATARDHRLVLAGGVADPATMAGVFSDYDAAVVEHQRVLAAVLTVTFDRDRPLNGQFDALVAFAMTHVARSLRLTSLAVLHAPGDQLSHEAPHGHLLVLARTHVAGGTWGPVHPLIEEHAHRRWAEDWSRFNEGWRDLDTG